MIKERNSEIDTLKILALIGMFILFPQVTYAASSIATIIGYACNWLSGEIAACVAVLVIIYSGFEMFSGEIDKTKLFVRCLGISITIGSSYIAINVFHLGGY